jgi:YgiT-type zinc finger domain-containing protein
MSSADFKKRGSYSLLPSMPYEVRKNMVCEFCGGHTRQRRVRKQHWFHKKLYVLEEVPAEVCTECGERYFHAQVLDAIDRMLEAEHLVKAHLQVEVASLQNIAVTT